eukprot:3664893-Rhodomonas_salina.4
MHIRRPSPRHNIICSIRSRNNTRRDSSHIVPLGSLARNKDSEIVTPRNSEVAILIHRRDRKSSSLSSGRVA